MIGSELEKEVYIDLPPRLRSCMVRKRFVSLQKPMVLRNHLELRLKDSQFSSQIWEWTCIFIGGNLVTWSSKRQAIVAKTSVEDEFKAMAQGI
ncbi:hypothetical protein CK203_023709 [Vitis vinifera]|uniref:Mitochondrial protein n=1 Tax=Vitis vinifera TaxID=29760 RepID=A0A438JBY5_VITVI|nr:hypothetical protein CK203_023709 [Vitis vinifera]